MKRACQPFDVFDAVETITGVYRCQVLSQSHHAEVVRARSLLCWACRLCCPTLSYPDIARATGRINHTSVVTSDHRAKRLFETDDGFRRDGFAVLVLLAGSVEVPDRVRGMLAVDRAGECVATINPAGVR